MKLLVRKARKGDKVAFQQLMQEQEISLYKIAKAILKNDDDAVDAMRETALVCWEKTYQKLLPGKKALSTPNGLIF